MSPLFERVDVEMALDDAIRRGLIARVRTPFGLQYRLKEISTAKLRQIQRRKDYLRSAGRCPEEAGN